MTLYEMTQDVRLLLDMLESDEIDAETVQDTIEGLDIEHKLEGYVHVIRELKTDIDRFKEEEKRLKDRRKVIENNVDKLSGAILNYMEAAKTDRATAGTFKLRVNTSRAVEITDEKAVPDKYKKTETVIAIAKNDIKKDLMAGVEIDGAILKENKSVVIR